VSLEVKLARIRELNDWYDEFDKRFPAWYRKIRLRARKIYEELEREGAPICRYGKDFDFTEYVPNLPPEREAISSLRELDEVEQRYVETIGMDVEEERRAGSHLQEDTTVVYSGFSDWARESLLPEHPDGVVVMNPDEAIMKFDWLREFVHRLVPIDLDKYTALCTAYSIGGVFLWVKRGVKVEFPLQACFLMEAERLAQLPYILVIVEPHAKVDIISGCVMHPKCSTGVHGCITEIYVGEGAQVSFNIIHNFKRGYHVRPKVGVLVEEGATYVENYISIGEPDSAQLYPTVILRGRGSRAVLRSLFFGRGHSDMDIGAAIIYTGEKCRGQIISRSVVLGEASVKMRGALKAYAPGARGHLECRALLLSDKAKAFAYPNLKSMHPDAMLTHEAAIGKIEDEQLYYLMSRGLSEEEAVALITRGFLSADIPELPPLLRAEIDRLISMTAKEVL